eukprot:3250717-Pyramimonas_sp.AAC.1
MKCCIQLVETADFRPRRGAARTFRQASLRPPTARASEVPQSRTQEGKVRWKSRGHGSQQVR